MKAPTLLDRFNVDGTAYMIAVKNNLYSIWRDGNQPVQIFECTERVSRAMAVCIVKALAKPRDGAE